MHRMHFGGFGLTSLVVLLVALVFASVAPAVETNMLVVFEDYPPYEYQENGVAKGRNIELIREAFRRMGLVPEFEPRPWKRGIYELKTGEILALASGFKNAEREEFAYFPSEPLFKEEVMVVTRKGSGLKVSSLEDLRPLSIGTVRSYVYGKEFDSMTGLNISPSRSNTQLLNRLFENRLDVIIANKAVVSHIAKKTNRLYDIDFLYEITSEPLYLFFSKAWGERARLLSEKFGEAIKSMKRDGTYSRIESHF